MTRKNVYYGNCIHLKMMYAKQTALCNTYSRVIARCRYYMCNVYDIKLKDDAIMCCVNVSPYTQQNCAHFEKKDNQKELTDFMSDKNE